MRNVTLTPFCSRSRFLLAALGVSLIAVFFLADAVRYLPGRDRILGVTITGAHAGELIVEYVAAMKNGIGLKRILGTIHVYPTFAEANKYAAGVWRRDHAPAKLLEWVERYHGWMRK